MNLEIRRFEQNLIRMINESELPIEAKRLVMKDVLHQVESVADDQVKKEHEAQKDAENNESVEEQGGPR